MPDTMLIAGPSDASASPRSLDMAPGLGLFPGAVVDTHFSERGRIGRLLGAVARNPQEVGLGIDEDTGLVVEGGQLARVIGSGAIYVVDGSEVSYSSLAERSGTRVISLYDVRLHMLAAGEQYDVERHLPMALRHDGSPRAAE